MNQKTMADVIAEDSTKFIKLPFFLTALQFSPLNKGCDITKEVFFPLLDKGLKLHFSEPGYILDGVKISNGDVKCALIRIDKSLLKTDIPRDKLFNKKIKTESGNEIELGDIFIGRDDVKQRYLEMGLDAFPWVTTSLPNSESDYIERPTISLRHGVDEYHKDADKILNNPITVMSDTPTNESSTDPWLIQDSKDPKPIQEWYIAARYFARQLVRDDSTLLTKRVILAGKVAISLDKVGIKKRGGKKPFNSSTIKKALSNIEF